MATEPHSIMVIAPSDLTPGMRSQLEAYCRNAGIPTLSLRIVQNITHGLAKKISETKSGADLGQRDVFFARLQQACTHYAVKTIVINDRIALEYLTQRYRSLAVTRGGVYFYNGIPCIVIDDLRTEGKMSKLASVPHAGWLLLEDLKKVKRWHYGEQKTTPRFEFTTADTIDTVRELLVHARQAVAIACDIETSGKGTGAIITASGYALLTREGAIRSYAVPLVSPLSPNSCHWSSDDLARVLEILRQVHAVPAPKFLQNGMYDGHYYVRYRMPLTNYIMDTAVAFHSVWPEIPKRLDFISSVVLDVYRYWKDENKEDDKDDNKGGSVPQSADGWHKYLRYNAMDCHFTLLCGLALGNLVHSVPWVQDNYRVSMRQFVGPGFAMSMRGANVNRSIQQRLELHNTAVSESARADLTRMVRNRDFNPNSPVQVASLVYDVLKATPLPQRGKAASKSKKGGAGVGNRSTDEKVLELVRTQHPLYSRIIQQIWNVKKPANNASKYGTFRKTEEGKWRGMPLFNGRWMYVLSPIGTETTRYASKASHFWTGTQIQNVPYEMRVMIEPDPGYVLFDFDYSKADFWHTAFASEEPAMMRIASDPTMDVHCWHASVFFKRPYDEIYAGYKAKEPWVVDSLHGVRQNAKRIVYGANYLMGGYTLFLTMGKDAVDAVVDFLGLNRAGWSIKQYTDFCQQQLDIYFSQMYPALMPWLERTIYSASRHGNRVTCCGGRVRTFFSNLQKDKGAQRELAAFFGQGGTAGMINKALDNIYFGREANADGHRDYQFSIKDGTCHLAPLDSQDLHLLFQVHDSVVGQVRKDKLHLLEKLKTELEVTSTINGHTFTVPAEGSVGMGWGYRMCEWHPDITIAEIQKADDKWKAKNSHLVTHA